LIIISFKIAELYSFEVEGCLNVSLKFI
jgi:hypothetical protein